jgi:thiamine pyrophosphokinase
MKCLIITAGAPPSNDLIEAHSQNADMIIGVDGAADTLIKHALWPDVLVGDFDSADRADVEKIEAAGAKLVRLPPQKNETDTEVAVNLALESGADDIVILGALGLRLDHALGNLALLIKAYRNGAHCRIIDEMHEITVAHGEYELHGRIGQTVSLLPMAGDATVTATGLVYPLDDLVLRCDAARGISNIIAESPARLRVSGGYALIIKIS